MAFKRYDPVEGGGFGYKESFAGFHNFKVVIEMLSYKDNWMMIRNSLVLWAFKLLIGLPVAIIFSYYVYKKAFGSRFFRVVLFLPNIISNLIMVYLFRYVANNAIATAFGLKFGLLDNPDTTFATILFFNLWLGFAGQTLLITSSMTSISDSIVEAAQVDGVNTISELFYITLPMIMPTLTTFVVLSIAEIFVDQMSLVTFYDKFSTPGHIKTVGYFLYQQALESDVVPTTSWESNHIHGKLSSPQLSAFGVMISSIIIPISFGVKKIMQYVDPNTD